MLRDLNQSLYARKSRCVENKETRVRDNALSLDSILAPRRANKFRNSHVTNSKVIATDNLKTPCKCSTCTQTPQILVIVVNSNPAALHFLTTNLQCLLLVYVGDIRSQITFANSDTS